MRRGLFIAGVVVLVIGVLLLGFSLSDPPSKTQKIVAGQYASLTNTRYTATTITVTWSGQPSGITVYLFSGAPTCSSSGAIASGSGASGSLSASVDPGVTVNLIGCSGSSPATVTITYSQTGGINLGEILGGFATVIGLLLLLFGLRRSADEPVRGSVGARGRRGTGDRFLDPAPPKPLVKPVPPPTAPKFIHGTPTADGRTLRGCTSCGKVSPMDGSGNCPACGAPY